MLFNETSGRDLKECEENLKTLQAQPAPNRIMFWRRTLIRIFAAHVEGLTYLLKQTILVLSPVTNVDFTVGEKAFLQEVSFEMDEKGQVTEKFLLTKFIRNFRFACACFCKVNHTNFALKYDDNGFKCFQEMVRIRDRLTHPKALSDLTVSDQEEQTVRRARSWFESQIGNMMLQCNNSFERYAEAIRKELATKKLKKG